jgi:diadenosine tetraphosphate (Ap4A) HIT family hydrolase
MEARTVFEDAVFIVKAPPLPLNSRQDEGHLVFDKKQQVHDRSNLTWQEAIDFMRISMAVGRAMYDVLGIELMNYEDLGNWSVDAPGGPMMHLHLFGRAHSEIHQIWGNRMFLYPKGHPIYQGHLDPLNEDEINRLRERIAELLEGEKHRKMAELAGVD